jgi:acetylornithine deacetylase/succinyl-diaminopimelate desuccinylase-like protein
MTTDTQTGHTHANAASSALIATRAPALQAFTNQLWDDEVVGALKRYIAIPAKSPMFDPQWEQHGHVDQVVREAATWIESKKVPGLTVEVIRLPGRTPVIFFDAPGTRASAAQANTVLLYGHLDKQPEFNGWRSDLGPWTPKLTDDGLLYGRGGADDGYAVYAALGAILALDAQGIPRPRCVGLIESSEESGSRDLTEYLDKLRPRFGQVGLVVCLDSGTGNYEQLWLTTSLRGNITGTLKVDVLTEGVHSGDASGVVPSSFRILRQLLDRLEDSTTGELLPAAFHCDIPQLRKDQAQATANILGDLVYKRFPWACGADGVGTLPTTTDAAQVLLNRTWRPTLSVTGAEGMPAIGDAGNVLRPYTAFKLSLRLPPLVDGHQAALQLQSLLQDNAPYHAKVSFHADASATGWNAPDVAPWLQTALDSASHQLFGAPSGTLGQGGTIPLMSMLQKGFPQAQMMVCGVLGPKSNAHGPNEFLHVPYAKRLTAAVAQVVAACP